MDVVFVMSEQLRCNILVGTWNVSNNRDCSRDLNEWIKRISLSLRSRHGRDVRGDARCFLPDFIIFGFQDFSRLLKVRRPNVDLWCQEIKISFDQYFPEASFDIIKHYRWVGLVLVLATRTSLSRRYRRLRSSNKDDVKYLVKEIPDHDFRNNRGIQEIRHSIYIKSIQESIVNNGSLYLGTRIQLVIKDHQNLRKERSISICIVNSKFSSECKNVEKRRRDYRRTCSRLVFPKMVSGNMLYDRVLDSDIIFWLGSLNYSLYDPVFHTNIDGLNEQSDLSEFAVENMIEKSINNSNAVPSTISLKGKNHNTISGSFYGPLHHSIESSLSLKTSDVLCLSNSSYVFNKDWMKMLKYDQLYIDMCSHKSFVKFNEGKIDFPPTHNYDTDSKTFGALDPSQGKPSWTDRILLRANRSTGSDWKIVNYLYESCHMLLSSKHKPVYGCYILCFENVTKNPEEGHENTEHASDGYQPLLFSKCNVSSMDELSSIKSSGMSGEEDDNDYIPSRLETLGMLITRVLLIPLHWITAVVGIILLVFVFI